MTRGSMDLNQRLRLFGVGILACGLCAALAVYLTAGPGEGPVIGYEMTDGGPYPISPFDSKQQMRSMELYGGKMGVMMYQFTLWFSGLWHGKALARTICVLTIAAAGLCFHLSRREPSASGNDGGTR